MARKTGFKDLSVNSRQTLHLPLGGKHCYRPLGGKQYYQPLGGKQYYRPLGGKTILPTSRRKTILENCLRRKNVKQALRKWIYPPGPASASERKTPRQLPAHDVIIWFVWYRFLSFPPLRLGFRPPPYVPLRDNSNSDFTKSISVLAFTLVFTAVLLYVDTCALS